MKKAITIWSIRIASLALLSLFTIIGALLNPQFLYANKTEVGNYLVYHDSELEPAFENRLAAVDRVIRASELYDPALTMMLCLNDGSVYPAIMETLRGPAFGWGFYNTAIFRGAASFEDNTVLLNGYKWNLEQLFAHELAHCMQYNALGFFKSNPVADHPHWKWEGYAEYASRKDQNQLSLFENIQRADLAASANSLAWGILFEDGTVAPREYYEDWLLVQYSLDIKGLSYRELLDESIPRPLVQHEMDSWYVQQQKLRN